MKQSLLPLCAVVLAGSTLVRSQETTLLVEAGDGVIWITHTTAAGMDYVLQMSANLVEWEATGPAKHGDGLLARQEVATSGVGQAFFRLVVTETVADLAPTEAEAMELFVGTTWGDGYFFDSPTRFNWRGEPGDWSYSKTGPDTALIVFTYDEDGNHPGIYREEVRLTFSTPTSGTYRYSEFYGGTEDPSSISHEPFSF
jgi:hypothetical protein